MTDLVLELLYVIIAVTIFSLISYKFKLPLIIGYILAGILLGNLNVLMLDESLDPLELASNLGLTFLLFIVGLKLDITSLKKMGNAFLLGLLKIIVIMGIGLGLSLAIGFEFKTAMFIAVGLSFSSTIVIVKLLSDKGELDSLPGRIALGTLIVEDIVAIICLIVINIIAGSDTSFSQQMLEMSINLIILAIIVFIVGKIIIPNFLKKWAKSTELLLIISIFFAIVFATLCEEFGFSKEVGAFIAGMMFAPHKEYRNIISSKLVPLRDVTLILFFVNFGIKVDFENITSLIPKILILTAFTVFIKPLITYTLMNYMKYKKNTAVKTGLILSQISEFSLIISSIGINKGLVDKEIMPILGVTLILTIFLSSLLMNYSDPITNLLTTKFKFKDNKWQRESSFESKNSKPTKPFKNLIIGADPFGLTLYEYMEIHEQPSLLVDFDPITVINAKEDDKNIVYGDVEDYVFLETINFREIKWIINTIPEMDHKKFIHTIKKFGFIGHYSAKADTENNTKEDLMKSGADLVFEPFINAAKEAFFMILEQDKKLLKEKKKREIEQLKEHYIICGFGRMGRQVAQDFKNENIPFVIVEENPEHIAELSNLDYYHIIGNASNDNVLKEAGIDRAKGLIAVYPTDELNVFIVLTAKNLNPNLDIVARSILESNKDKLKSAGANKVISPYIFGGRKIASAVLRPTVFEFNEKTYHGNECDINFEELLLSENCSFIGKTIAESNFRQTYGVTIIAIKKESGEFIPNPNFDIVFDKNDILVVIANAKEINNISNSSDFSLIGGKQTENK